MGRLVSIRKNLNISVENERRIQGFRSMTLGLDPPVDLDYTQATNILIELGFLVLEQTGQMNSLEGPLRKVLETFGNHLGMAALGNVDQEDAEERAKEIVEMIENTDFRASMASLSAFQPKPRKQASES